MLGTSRWLRHVGVALVFVMAGSGCRSTVELTIVDNHDVSSTPVARNVKVTPEPAVDDNPFADSVLGGGVDFRLTRDDIECSEQ